MTISRLLTTDAKVQPFAAGRTKGLKSSHELPLLSEGKLLGPEARPGRTSPASLFLGREYENGANTKVLGRARSIMSRESGRSYSFETQQSEINKNKNKNQNKNWNEPNNDQHFRRVKKPRSSSRSVSSNNPCPQRVERHRAASPKKSRTASACLRRDDVMSRRRVVDDDDDMSRHPTSAVSSRERNDDMSSLSPDQQSRVERALLEVERATKALRRPTRGAKQLEKKEEAEAAAKLDDDVYNEDDDESDDEKPPPLTKGLYSSDEEEFPNGDEKEENEEDEDNDDDDDDDDSMPDHLRKFTKTKRKHDDMDNDDEGSSEDDEALSLHSKKDLDAVIRQHMGEEDIHNCGFDFFCSKPGSKIQTNEPLGRVFGKVVSAHFVFVAEFPSYHMKDGRQPHCALAFCDFRSSSAICPCSLCRKGQL
jgi:hypothetical protein